jgi:metal-responsive CopG/Arc/MetJ family transcriptional regulator
MAKVMISMPDELLKRVDHAAKQRKTSRSGFLRNAAESQLERPTPQQVRRAIEEGRRLLSDVGSFDSTEAIREDRDSRKY